ncbi:MAG TPA: hypothetical protein VJN18_20360 [Polyangiaceae bacterium]|nr:hypothetical protein [Polyangiaceae bacterium]
MSCLMVAIVVLDERERAGGFRGVPWSFGALCAAPVRRWSSDYFT